MVLALVLGIVAIVIAFFTDDGRRNCSLWYYAAFGITCLALLV